MNRIVYLAGPINGLTYKEAVGWREWATKEFEKVGIEARSPMRCKHFLESLPILDKPYDNPLTLAPGIVSRDFYDVDISQVIFANFLGATKLSGGTFAEYGRASASHIEKPIITVIEKSGNPNDHPFITALTGFRVETLESGIDIVKAILLPK